MKKTLTVMLTILLLITGAVFAQMEEGQKKNSDCGEECSPQKKRHMMRKMNGQDMKGKMMQGFLLNDVIAEKLELTNEQKEKLQTLRTNKMEQNKDKRAELMKARKELWDMMMKLEFDRPAIEKQHRKIADMQIAMRMEMLNSFEEALEILTPEQKTKMQDIWREFWEKKAAEKGEKPAK